MKKLILFLITVVTIILLAHLWLDTSSFKEWMNTYAIFYIVSISILMYVLKEKPTEKFEDNEKLKHDGGKCIEMEDHFHWIARTTSILSFFLFQALVAIWIYYYLQDPDLTAAQIRKKSGLLYVFIPIFTIGYFYFYGLAFYIRNKSFNRNIFLCENYIYCEYPSKKTFEECTVKSLKIDITNIKEIVWTPIDKSTPFNVESKGIKNIIEEVFNHLIVLPITVTYILVKFIYYVIHGFSLKYFFKNLLIISEDKVLLIQIKNEEEYLLLKNYFKDFNFDTLNYTLSSKFYFIKDKD